MTLISMINGFGFPILISDRAISQKGSSQSILLPSTNSKTTCPTPVIGFNVKTIIVQDILCVGFAGNLSVIESWVSEIKDYFLHRAVTMESLENLLETLEDSPGSSIIFAIGGPEFSGNTTAVYHAGNWISNDSKENLRILSCGSGAETFTSHFVEQAAYLDESEINAKFCQQRVLSICISFLNHERKATSLLRNGWGGGFDLVYYENGKFQRLNELTFAFYVVDAGKVMNPIPVSLIHQSYSDGNVVVRHFTEEGYEIYSISELGEKIPCKDQPIDCISREIISCVHLFKDAEYITDLGVLFWDINPDAEPAFYTTRKDDKFGVQFRPIYIEKIKEAIKLFLN